MCVAPFLTASLGVKEMKYRSHQYRGGKGKLISVSVMLHSECSGDVDVEFSMSTQKVILG